jgi:branched-chain amino acid transport system ATP-binding protein
MLAIGRALMAARLLLLDEPSLGLAPQIVQTIFQIIREINAAGRRSCSSSRTRTMALEAADHRGYVLEVGEIVLSARRRRWLRATSARGLPGRSRLTACAGSASSWVSNKKPGFVRRTKLHRRR